jgi:beta-galactosidase
MCQKMESYMSPITRRHLLKSGLIASAGLVGSKSFGLSKVEAHTTSSQSSPAAAHPESWEPATVSPRERLLLDFGWRFHLGNAGDHRKDFDFGAPAREGTFAKAAFVASVAEDDFDDSAWRLVDLPHDWAVELPYVNGPELSSHGSKAIGRDYPETSIGWYRRSFFLPAEDAGKRISLDFDGVFRDAIVLFNGHYLGRNFSGYLPFQFDVSDYVNYGGTNHIVVRVDASLAEGWFYEGAGIYRHVWLTKTHPLHVAQYGTFVQSELKGNQALVSIGTEVSNQSAENARCQLYSRILDASGKLVASAQSKLVEIPAWATTTVESETRIADPKLWSIEEPNLYRVATEVHGSAGVTDHDKATFGIRTIRFDSEKGFFLNGQPVKIKGTCNHQDHAGVGAAVPDQIQSRRITLLKGFGSNACRTAHNPVATEVLDACDNQGMLVMSEARIMASVPEGMSQLERMIRRDRNHPSIILWSLANEEPDQGSSVGARVIASMKRVARQLDPTRPVTAAMNGGWGEGISGVVDVQGFNYSGEGGSGASRMASNIDDFHKKFPRQPMIGTETASAYSSRGIYANSHEKGHVSAYDLNFPSYTLSSEGWWILYAERAYLSGGFAWTGFDYRGEPSPYSDVSVGSQFGIMDSCGFPKDVYYYYKSWWSSEPVLHLFPHWNWSGQEGQSVEVWCYSNLESVELFLNGRSLGQKNIARNSHAQWTVMYQPGVLEAHGFKGGKMVLIDRRETTGKPGKIVLHPDRSKIAADGEDVSIVAVEVQDGEGRVVPTASDRVRFTLAGPGRIIGVGNGDPSSREADKPESSVSAMRSAFSGLCMVFVQSVKSAGTIQIQASVEGLEPVNVAILSETAVPRPAIG